MHSDPDVAEGENGLNRRYNTRFSLAPHLFHSNDPPRHLCHPCHRPSVFFLTTYSRLRGLCMSSRQWESLFNEGRQPMRYCKTSTLPRAVSIIRTLIIDATPFPMLCYDKIVAYNDGTVHSAWPSESKPKLSFHLKEFLFLVNLCFEGCRSTQVFFKRQFPETPAQQFIQLGVFPSS